MRTSVLIVGLFWVLNVSALAHAETLFETGPIAGTTQRYSVSDDNWIAMPIEFDNKVEIQSVEGYFFKLETDLARGGAVRAAIYSSTAEGLPGDVVLASPPFAVDVGGPDWFGVNGLDWSLPEGEYFVGFFADDDNPFVGKLPFDSGDSFIASYNVPLPPEAPFWGRQPGREVGIRVIGNVVPEPASITLLVSGLFVGAVVQRSRSTC